VHGSGNTLGNTTPNAALRKREGLPAVTCRKPFSLIRVTNAEGKGLEPSTGKPAPDFESSNSRPLTSRCSSIPCFSRVSQIALCPIAIALK
jgi:hypothetical protein